MTIVTMHAIGSPHADYHYIMYTRNKLHAASVLLLILTVFVFVVIV